jgi:hypothetical protein
MTMTDALGCGKLLKKSNRRKSLFWRAISGMLIEPGQREVARRGQK